MGPATRPRHPLIAAGSSSPANFRHPSHPAHCLSHLDDTGEVDPPVRVRAVQERYRTGWIGCRTLAPATSDQRPATGDWRLAVSVRRRRLSPPAPLCEHSEVLTPTPSDPSSGFRSMSLPRSQGKGKREKGKGTRDKTASRRINAGPRRTDRRRHASASGPATSKRARAQSREPGAERPRAERAQITQANRKKVCIMFA